MGPLIDSWFKTAQLVGTYRKLWIPFLALAGVELFLLGILWLAPHPPFSAVLAPPIRYFYSDRLLHYPLHLWFLYWAMKHTHLIASLLVGAYLSGVACVMVRQIHEGKELSFREALVSKQVPYGRVVLLWLLAWGVARVVAKGFFHWAPLAPQHVLLVVAACSVILAALFAYTIPAAVFNGSKWWKALLQGMKETLRYPLSTLWMVALPVWILLLFSMEWAPVQVLKSRALAETPERVLGLVLGRLFLWTAAEAVLTVGIAHLWWFHRGAEVKKMERKKMRQTARDKGQGKAWSLKPAAGSLLLCLLLTFAVTGCSSSYSGERLYWKAQKFSAPLSKSPDAGTPEQYKEAIQRFEKVAEVVPGTVWAGRAKLSVGSLYAARGQYDQAREAYAWILQNHSQNASLALRARTVMAKTYEFEQQWDQMVEVYRQIADHHPWTKKGMESLVGVAQFHERRGESVQSRKDYVYAVRHYQRLIDRAPSEQLAARAKSYLTLVYRQLGQWDEAAQILEEMAKTPEAANRPMVLLKLAQLYDVDLLDAKKAEATYTQLAKEFPEHPLGKMAQVHLEAMKISTEEVRAQ